MLPLAYAAYTTADSKLIAGGSMSRLDEHLFWVVGAGAKYTFTSLHSAQGGRQPAQVGRGGDGAQAGLQQWSSEDKQGKPSTQSLSHGWADRNSRRGLS